MPISLKAIALCAAFTSTAVRADDIIAEYHFLVSHQDMVNSQGEPLHDFAAIVAQDRANYHRFGKADEADAGDPIFGSRQMRARIPEFYNAGSGVDNLYADPLNSGIRELFVRVLIMGQDGRVTRLEVLPVAG